MLKHGTWYMVKHHMTEHNRVGTEYKGTDNYYPFTNISQFLRMLRESLQPYAGIPSHNGWNETCSSDESLPF